MDFSTYSNWHSGFYEHIVLPAKNHPNQGPKSPKMREKRPIKVYIRVRPFNDEEKERNEASALEVFKDESRIKVLDERHSLETSYVFDGVFGEADDNQRVYNITAKPLINKLLNGINCALLTYGQTGTGKTHTVLAEGSVTNFTIDHLFDRIAQDTAHIYKVSCSFVQVYQDKVYDLLNPESNDELFVREHPKKGIYVANLSHHMVKSGEMALELLSEGRKQLIIAETKMVRHSSRSHAIFQLSIERRLDPNGKSVRSKSPMDESIESSQQSDLNNSCDLEENEMYAVTLEEDIILKGKLDICDLAGSERLGKTMAEGVRLSEAKHINSSLLELGNVIYALSEGTRRHIPFRNSTLTRLLQECLGPQCRTSFIVCVAPTASEAYETRCSLNFGTRARKITNKERLILNVEVDYKILAKRLAKRIEALEQDLENSGTPQIVHLTDSTTCAPITVQTQTEIDEDGFEREDAVKTKNLMKFPQLEMIMISEIMTSIWKNFNEKMEAKRPEILCNSVPCLLNELLDTVARQHQTYTLTEDHWAEADIKQILKDSMDDVDLLQQSFDNEVEASLQSNDVMKHMEFICRQFNERCVVMEQDMNYCVDKFQDILPFNEDSTLHSKMKQIIEFLDNNCDGEISELMNSIELGFDVEFMSWLISAQMALRFIVVLLKISIKTNGPKVEDCVAMENENKEDLMNETFESITSINDDSTIEELDESYINFNDYVIGVANDDEMYAKSSTPKRGHFLPLSIQNQLYNTCRDQSTFNSKDSFFTTFPGYRGNMEYIEPKIWSKRGNLSMSLASGVSDIDSIDGTFDEMDITHEQRLKHRRSMDNNVMKLEEKCELLEDKNSKLITTLNVIMRENKDLNEKLRITHVEKSKMTRELQDFEHQLQKVLTDKKALQSNLSEVNGEKVSIEKELKKCHMEIKGIEIDNNGLQRQISMKDGENESLRQQIVEFRTEIAASKADLEKLSKQVEETEEKRKANEKDLEESTKEHKSLISQLQDLCSILEKATSEEADGEESTEVRRRTNSYDIADSEGTFETELFVAIENNVRIESIINEVKGKLDKMVGSKEEVPKEVKKKGKKEKLMIVEPCKTSKRRNGQLPRSGETKTSTLRRAKSLKTERKANMINKESEGIVPRGSKIKELMNEKLKIESSYKEAVLKNEKLEEELKTTKTQIEMLVKECGMLDHQLASLKKNSKQKEDFCLEEAKDLSGNSEDSLFLRTKDINKLGEAHEEMKKSLQMSQNKIQDLESELAMSRDEIAVVKRHARETERKYEGAKNELHHYESQNYSQKIENTRLRDHVIQLSQEVNREQQRVDQLSSKLSTVKERNAGQIRKLECEMMKCVKKLDRYRERERDRRQQIKRLETSTKDSSEADSGLVPDHSDENIDLT